MRLSLRAVVALAGCCTVPSAHALITSESQNAATQGLGVSAAGSWSGVGNIVLNGTDPVTNQWCTGTVIESSTPGVSWVLTAAHCLYDNAGALFDANNDPKPGKALRVNFPEAGITNTFYNVQKMYPNPNFTGSVFGGSDTALLKLGVDVSSVTTKWKINRGQIPDERAGNNGNLTAHKVGFGRGGDGSNGDTANAAGVPVLGSADARQGIKREGTNRVDMFGPVTLAQNVFDTSPGANGLRAPADTLIYDFDDHNAAANGRPVNGPLSAAQNAALAATPLNAQFSGANGATGLGEADTAPGDSGGPMFMYDFAAGKFIIVGVTSYGTDTVGSRFGDIAVDARVRDSAAWIDSIVPEPGTLMLLCPFAFIRVRRQFQA